MTLSCENINAVYRLLKIKGIGPVQTNKILLSIKTKSDIVSQIEEVLKDSQLDEFKSNNIDIIDTLDSEYPVNFISLLDELYPADLKKYLKVNTPPLLSYIGNINLLKKHKVGFSGSRKVSNKGIAITRDCVEQLLEKDISIVSGYAAGVDMTAHSIALQQGGSTIIVLPEGINYFKIKQELKDIWDWERVLVISEFSSSEKWMAGRAMQRNNTIIGLSDIMVVVEAGETGGSFDAGLKTISLGKYLFTPMYSNIPDSALGNNLLIQNGALPIKMNRETQKANLNKMFELLSAPHKYEFF